MTEPVYVQWRTDGRLSKVHVVHQVWSETRTLCGLDIWWLALDEVVERGPNPCRRCIRILERQAQ